ncbi:MAG: segregation/condensation protein A, partial [Nanoarchaeota archaeon]|nr:segregation/condensation protein A [Nanoarchaeota archaeon]
MQQKIFDMLLQKDELGWKDILYNLIKNEEMDPWDINITVLTQKYIELIKKMQQHDLIISGKVLLAAALLLKIKSAHLLDTDIARLDSLLNPTEEEIEEELWDEIEGGRQKNKEKYALIPRNPQPRNR